MLVSLFTVRVILRALGEEDYGIYNVVAGVVVLFTFVNDAMAQATQRFLNFSLGHDDENNVREVFSASMLIHAAIAVLFFILAESVGLWFVSTQLNIPENRIDATAVVYQLVIVTSLFNIIKVPYNAVIIAYEKMSFYAGVSIVEVFLKILVAFLIAKAPTDKLVFYTFLMMWVSIIMFLVYWLFCRISFTPIRYRKVNDRHLAWEMASFSGWSLLGATANMCNHQGTSIVLNMFTNVTVNAAMGIANQVNAAVYSFVQNFRTAFNPQIVKSWASGDKKYFDFLVFSASKVSFFLCLYFVVPIFLCSDFLLTVWLKEVPAYSSVFVKLVLLCSLVESVNGAMVIAAQAYGDIKKYQLIISCMITANLPLTIVAFMLGAGPVCVLIIRLILDSIITLWRIWFLRHRIDISARSFMKQVILRCIACAAISFFGTWIICRVFDSSWLQLVFCIIISVLLTSMLVLLIGLSKKERHLVLYKLKGFCLRHAMNTK